MDFEDKNTLKRIENNTSEINKSIKELLDIFIRMEKDYSSDPEYHKMIEKEGIARPE